MKKTNPPAKAVVDGQEVVVPEHTLELLCSSCGFDLDESELNAAQCSDCGQPLSLKQNIAIKVTTMPISGATM